MAHRAGISSLQRHLDANSSYSTLSSTLASEKAATLSNQLSTFQSQLSTFSTRHRAKILSNPDFRQRFSQLCFELGVDPLGGGQKGLWDKIGVGDWYYALGVQIVDVCLKARDKTGGYVSLDQVIQSVTVLRNGGEKARTVASNAITEADVKRAIEALEPLGCGYEIIEMGGRKMVRCYPGQLDRDSLIVVQVASATGRGAVTLEEMKKELDWEDERIERALEKALESDGMVWIDSQKSDASQFTWDYYVPALFDFGS